MHRLRRKQRGRVQSTYGACADARRKLALESTFCCSEKEKDADLSAGGLGASSARYFC